MIRYNFHRDESGAYMVEDADGEYVRYAEVHPLVDGDLATQRAICDGLPGPNVPQGVDWEKRYDEEYAIVDRCWKALGISTYAQAKGQYIDDLIAAAVKDAARYRWLKANYDLAIGENPASLPFDDLLVDAAMSEPSPFATHDEGSK